MSILHVVINPTWRCQLRCAYCWLPHVKINRKAKEHAWDEWAEALIRTLPRGSVVDVAGGEPLLYDHLPELLMTIGQAGLRWAISTNALATDAVTVLCALRPPGGECINVSDHAGNAAAHENVERLRQVFPVRVHRVAHPAAGTHEGQAGSIPYQEWAEGNGTDGVVRECDAGVRHWVADPGGDVFRCCVAMQVADVPIGNLFEGGVAVPSPFVCEYGCSSCYTTEPDAWRIHMQAVTR